MQQVKNVLDTGTADSTDYIKDSILENQKLQILVKDLLSSEYWRRQCLSILLKTTDFNPPTTLPIDILLENELTVLNLIEASCYHADTLDQMDELILDLIDYAHRALNEILT